MANQKFNTGLSRSQITEAFRRALNDLTDAQIIALIDGAKEQLESEIAEKANTADLAAVATSGSYTDLSDTPETDAAPTENSTNTVQSGGVYAALAALDLNAVTGVTPMITNASRAETVCGKDLDNLPANSVACVGSTLSDANLANQPVAGFRGVIITVAYNPSATSNGVAQIAVSAEGVLYTRIKWGSSVWTAWETHENQPDVYYVTPSDSLTALFYDLKDDAREKIIYVQGGEYDIFQEYKDLGIATPPDDVSSSDYLDRCVFVPRNTKLIGIGNVKLTYNPAKADTTKGEARTWSPLNVRYACHIENIEIYCHYGRYCIHDDSHNNAEDQGVTHTYKNVKCTYDYSDDSYGFNETIGFGFSQKSTYIFDNCTFIYNEDASVSASQNRSAFYGHSASGTLTEEESARIIVRDCVCKAGETSTKAFRLQSLNTSDIRIITDVINTYIDGQVILTIYDETRKQAFDCTFLNTNVTAADVTIDDTNNLYPVNIVPVMDTTPTDGSTNAVTSGGVFTALGAKMPLGLGTLLDADANLFSLSVGKYYYPSAPAATMSNVPSDLTAAFYCEVVNTISTQRRRILLYPSTAATSGAFYTCLETGAGYGTWYKFTGTAVT